MKPNLKNLISKGLLGIRKAVSLITKGFLDEITQVVKQHGGQGRIKQYGFEWHYRIVGKRAFVKEFIYSIKGIKLCETIRRFNLKAKTLTKTVQNFIIKAKKEIIFKETKKILALVGQKIESIFNLNGIKRFQLQSELTMAGVTQFNLYNACNINAVKSYKISNESIIKGTKEIKIKEDMLLKGKRDIINILISTGILRIE